MNKVDKNRPVSSINLVTGTGTWVSKIEGHPNGVRLYFFATWGLTPEGTSANHSHLTQR